MSANLIESKSFRIIFTAFLAFLGGYAFNSLGIYLPWMLGPLFVVMIAKVKLRKYLYWSKTFILAFSAVANHDRVGAVLFSDRIESYVPPGRGRDHALRIVRDLLGPRAARPRHRSRGRLAFRARRPPAARDRGGDLRFPGPGLRAGHGRPASAPRRRGPPPLRPARGPSAVGRPRRPPRSGNRRAMGWPSSSDPAVRRRLASSAGIEAERSVQERLGSMPWPSLRPNPTSDPCARSSSHESAAGDSPAGHGNRHPRPRPSRDPRDGARHRPGPRGVRAQYERDFR